MTSGNNAFKIFAVVLAVTLAVSLIAYRQYNAGASSDPFRVSGSKSARAIDAHDLKPDSPRGTSSPTTQATTTQPVPTTDPAFFGGSKGKPILILRGLTPPTTPPVTSPAQPEHFQGLKSAPIFRPKEDDFLFSSEKPSTQPATQPVY